MGRSMVNETHGAYYVVALKDLKPDNTYNQSVVIHDGQGNSTKFLALNQESIPVLITFLQDELKRLESLKKG